MHGSVAGELRQSRSPCSQSVTVRPLAWRGRPSCQLETSWPHGFCMWRNFAHVPHMTWENHWGWLCCCSFNLEAAIKREWLVGRAASSWHSSLLWKCIQCCNGQQWPELNHLPTVQRWPPLIISCLETRGTVEWRAVSKQQWT